MADGIFAGLRVIDYASWIAGPAAAAILSDFGAGVIKIEPSGAAAGVSFRYSLQPPSLRTMPSSPQRNGAASPTKRLDCEIKRRTDVGIFPNEDAIPHPVGALLLRQNDPWAVQRARYITLEGIAPIGDEPLSGLPDAAA